MAEPKRLEKILIDDISARRDNGIDHPIFNEIDNDLFQTRADQRAGKAHNDRTAFIFDHHIVNFSRAVQVACLKGHVPHGLDHRHGIHLFYVDMLDRLGK